MIRKVFIFCVLCVQVFGQKFSRRPIPIFRDQMPELLLPNNATAIRENIVDTFSCENRIYGYYADIDNECQVFHVCMPQNRGSRRWSFICPAETVFNQETFVCTRINESIPCEESEQYYVLNEEFGKEEPEDTENEEDNKIDGENQPTNPQDNQQAPGYAPDTGYTNEVPAVTPFSRNPRTRARPGRRGKNSRFGTTLPGKNERYDTTPLNFIQ
uniref:Cuticular protein 1-N n=1 Tax=Microplitis mediator TaxID=375433 RepID=A0A650DLI3_9HYME|nr:cuticular protein 1-N [Microplitis mediator]